MNLSKAQVGVAKRHIEKEGYMYFKSKVRKMVLVVLAILLLILYVLASIGVSSITGDYNYFGITLAGTILILVSSCVIYLALIIARRLSAVLGNKK